jgi:hypothetical protein
LNKFNHSGTTTIFLVILLENQEICQKQKTANYVAVFKSWFIRNLPN